MTKGKLIIIEAGDGSGKATQTKRLYDHLVADGRRVHRVEFPDYASDSSALVRMYLAGKFGGHADDVNAYAASTFFAVDRYASYRTKWKAWYDAGDIILADRYTTSNMVHQAVKIEDEAQRDAFLAWLQDLEFAKIGLPVPDAVIFLDMDSAVAQRLIDARAKASGTASCLQGIQHLPRHVEVGIFRHILVVIQGIAFQHQVIAPLIPIPGGKKLLKALLPQLEINMQILLAGMPGDKMIDHAVCRPDKISLPFHCHIIYGKLRLPVVQRQHTIKTHQGQRGSPRPRPQFRSPCLPAGQPWQIR